MRKYISLLLSAGALLFCLMVSMASCSGTPTHTTPTTGDTATQDQEPNTEDTIMIDTNTTSAETGSEEMTEAASETGSEAMTETVNETVSVLVTETISETEPELFAPDPERAIPKYDELMSHPENFPLYFKYGDTEYSGFAGFELESESYENVDRGVKTTWVLRHPNIPSSFRLEATVYPQEAAYEYVVYITNDSQENTDIFSDLSYQIDFVGEKPTISGIKGDAGGQNYTPYEHDLSRRTRYTDRSTSGRPSHSVFPYYNLSYGNGGTFIAIGWPGTWYASYSYEKSSKTTTLSTGQGDVATYIAPGETLRTPLMGFVEYEGLTADEQTNAWRHYYLNDVMRKIDGEMVPTYAGIGNMSQGMTTQKELLMLKAYLANSVSPDVIWMDAGWYTGADGESVSWSQTGSLDIDYSRFPDGMASIGEFAEQNDAMFLLWFEPENMRLDTEAFLAGQPDFKKEWLLGEVATGTWLQSRIINLGDSDCRAWIFAKISKVIETAGVTGYRQDFNNDPAPAWAENDAKTPGRTGMTENQYVQGYLALWDAIIDKYGIFIDSCASGGGRNDLESMKRGLPLHYTDWFDGNNEDYDMKGKMTQALFAWFPYFKNESYQSSLYKFRMNYAPFCLLKVSSALDKDTDWELVRQAYAEYDLIRDYFYGDYYALTEWSANADRWDARMFYVPDSGEGFAFIACQEASSTTTNTVKLKGLDPDKLYKLTDLDGLVDITADGKTLMEQGITVTVPEQPYAVIVLIKPAE